MVSLYRLWLRELSTIGYQRGNCDFDVRHNLSAAFSYDLPNVGHSGFANAVLHHWGLDDRFTARTAFPVTLNGNSLLATEWAELLRGTKLGSGSAGLSLRCQLRHCSSRVGRSYSGQGCPGGRAINPNAFTAVSSGLGDAPRNFARGFGAWQMDLAVRRDFPIYEKPKAAIPRRGFQPLQSSQFRSDQCSLRPTYFWSGYGYACEFSRHPESALPAGRSALDAVRSQISFDVSIMRGYSIFNSVQMSNRRVGVKIW